MFSTVPEQSTGCNKLLRLYEDFDLDFDDTDFLKLHIPTVLGQPEDQELRLYLFSVFASNPAFNEMVTATSITVATSATIQPLDLHKGYIAVEVEENMKTLLKSNLNAHANVRQMRVRVIPYPLGLYVAAACAWVRQQACNPNTKTYPSLLSSGPDPGGLCACCGPTYSPVLTALASPLLVFCKPVILLLLVFLPSMYYLNYDKWNGVDLLVGPFCYPTLCFPSL
ncbi:unnamed protein product [Taenia asiatica]|uniref:FAD-binding FR-type domain-containing protein n=1 Tax=Taenia asiatica TaxID=60517 RepID=A0A158R8E4_TAEAS|nr:unnamed protein product [Taenia asiatica]